MTSQSNGSLTLQRGKIIRPQRAVIYGPEGVGKSTLAAQFPAPLFLDTEGGTHHLDVVRFPPADSWEQVQGAVASLNTPGHGFKTLVIDTADWLEKRIAEHVCRKATKESIEDFGYGRGYVLVAEEFARFLAGLEPLVRRGMHIVFLAHSTVRKFESPEQAGSYDRHELELSKQVGPLLKEWADLLLFANFVARVAEDESGRRRGVGGKERVLYTTHSAAFDAKNRHGLDEKLPFKFDSIARVFGVEAPPVAPPAPEQPAAERLVKLFEGKEDAVRAFLLARGQIKEDGDWGSIPAEYATRILAEPERFLAAVEGSKGGAA